MRTLTVLELRVDFKYDLEEVRRQAIGQIMKAIGRWAKPARHGKATCSFVIVSSETAVELLGRLAPALKEISSIDHYCAHFAPRSAVSKTGTLDPYIHWLATAWKIVGEDSQSKNMRQFQRRGPAKGRV